MYHRKNREVGDHKAFDARSRSRQVGGEGMGPLGVGRRSSELVKTIGPVEREGTSAIEVVHHGLKQAVPTRRNAVVQAILVHWPTWVGKGMEPVVLLPKQRQQ